MMHWQGGTSWYNRWTPQQWREWLKEPKDKESIDEEESDDELRWDGSSYGEPICQLQQGYLCRHRFRTP